MILFSFLLNLVMCQMVRVTIIDDNDYARIIQLMDFVTRFFSRGDLKQRDFAKRVSLLRERIAFSEKDFF